MKDIDAAKDLEYIRDVMARTQRRIDPHAFHFVHWGAIVLVWYPLANLFEHLGHTSWLLPLGVGAIVLGAILSGVREARFHKSPRVDAEDTFVSKQMILIVFPLLASGFVLSAVAPATQFVDGREVPVIWGLLYACLAFMVGVVYTREFLYAGVAIFLGTIAAMIFENYNGYILGPFMGLGLIIPGRIAERRVQQLVEEDLARATV